MQNAIETHNIHAQQSCALDVLFFPRKMCTTSKAIWILIL